MLRALMGQLVLCEQDGADETGDVVLVAEDAEELGVLLALAVEPLDGLVEWFLAERCGGDLMYRRRVSSPRASAGSGSPLTAASYTAIGGTTG